MNFQETWDKLVAWAKANVYMAIGVAAALVYGVYWFMKKRRISKSRRRSLAKARAAKRRKRRR